MFNAGPFASATAAASPIGARRVRTDLKTSENRYQARSANNGRPRTSSPIAIKQVHQQQQQYYHTYHHPPQQQQLPHWHANVAATLARAQSSRRTTAATTVASAKASKTPHESQRDYKPSSARYLSSNAPPSTHAVPCSAHLPARATRLLNRSRLQQQCPLNNADSDSSKSAQSVRRSTANSRASTATTSHAAAQQSRHHHAHHPHAYRDIHSSSDDLMLYDKSFRNAMIQDVLHFKKQLLRLRRILQETETLNPFENDNGQLFATCGLNSKLLDDIDFSSLTSSTTDDPLQELTDLRRQVVYLQGQVDDRERTIRLQRNHIAKLEAEKTAPAAEGAKECINIATQTERTRPISIGAEGLSRSKPEYTSYMTYFPAVCSSDPITQQQQQYRNQCVPNQTRRHTIISATLTNYNHQLAANAASPGCSQHKPRRASIAWEKPTATYKPVKITLIGEPMKSTQNGSDEHKPAPNGKSGADGIGHTQNGCRHPENGTSNFQLQPLQQSCLQPPISSRNGNLNPTVTIV